MFDKSEVVVFNPQSWLPMASSLQNIKDKVVYKFLEFFVFGLSLMIPSVQKYMADQIDGKLHTSLVLVKKELDEQRHHLT